MPHGNLTTVSTSATETAVLREERSDATTGDPRSGRSPTMQSKSSLEPPDRAAAGGPGQVHGETRRPGPRSDVVGGRAQAATARKRAVAAAIAERGLRRAAGAGLAVLRPPAPGSPRDGAYDSTALFSRHSRGAIEAERDRRLQRRRHAATAYPAGARARCGRPHARITAAIADARAIRQEARLDIDRWVGEGDLVPFGTAAVVRSSTTTRR
jgi:hypothetical protein